MPPARLLLRFPSLLAGPALAATVGGVAFGAASGCYYNDAGTAPPGEGFYYPTGLVVSPGRNALYVANSDFDLNYNGGTVDVVDLTDATGLRGTLGPMLAGIRCSGGALDACGGPGAPPGVLLEGFCNTIPTSTGPGASGNGTTGGSGCQVAGDCVSGYCAIGSNGIDGNCQPCGLNPDGSTNVYECSGACIKGMCMLGTATNQILSPAACTPVQPPFRWAATIGAFASGAVLALNPDTSVGGARLFVPVRGDPSITWFDVPDDRPGSPAVTQPWRLDCGQGINGARCADSHRMGVDPYENFRDLTIPVEPVGLDISSDGVDIVTAHQIATTPAIGLSINQWPAACPAGSPTSCVPFFESYPSFEYYLTGSVAGGPTEVAHLKPPGIVAASIVVSQGDPTKQVAYLPGFAVTYNQTPEIDIFRVNADAQSSPRRPYLLRSSTASVTVNATGTDSRGIAIDTSERDACEAACSPTDLACLGGVPGVPYVPGCIDVPMPVYIANRSPASLLIGQVVSTLDPADPATGTGSGVSEVIDIYNTVPLTTGPSKVVLGTAIGPDGNAKTLVFAVAFDTLFVHVYDPVAQTVIAHIRTGLNPQAITFDTCLANAQSSALRCAPGEAPHAYLYVGHFTDSYLGVVDLDMRHGGDTFGTMFASIGSPQPALEQVQQ